MSQHYYTIQVSNHPGAGSRIPTADAAASWNTVYDGPLASSTEARKAVNTCADFYRHARAFRGKEVGKMWYAVLRMGGDFPKKKETT